MASVRLHFILLRCDALSLSEWVPMFRRSLEPLCRGKLPVMGRFPNFGKCIISYQEVLRSVFKNVNH